VVRLRILRRNREPVCAPPHDAPSLFAAYRVSAVDNNGVSSPNSVPDFASVRTFTTDPLPVGGLTIIQAIHVSELRAAIDAVRYAVGRAAGRGAIALTVFEGFYDIGTIGRCGALAAVR
jgi:hypothetical protein